MQKTFFAFFIGISFLFSSLVWAGEVSRSQFTTEIIDREPTDMIITLSTNQHQIRYFTELTDLKDHQVTHQWIYNDNVMFEKTFQVGGNRWRVWSSKTLQPGWAGRWSVNVLNEDRSLLSTQDFEYQ